MAQRLHAWTQQSFIGRRSSAPEPGSFGVSASVFLQGLGNSSLKDLICVMQEVGRSRGQERGERGKGRGSSHNSAFIPSVTER